MSFSSHCSLCHSHVKPEANISMVFHKWNYSFNSYYFPLCWFGNVQLLQSFEFFLSGEVLNSVDRLTAGYLQLFLMYNLN